MSPQSNQPLTLCPQAALDWSRADTPASTAFDDIYFSVDNGLAETRDVYLRACGLPERWEDATEVFTIAELGFGTGLNFLATLQAWQEAKNKQTQRLHYISIEKFPLSRATLLRALAPWTELSAYRDALLAQWPGRVRGIHRLHFGDVTLTLIHDDVLAALDALSFKADAWFLDGFSPARNPDMWSEDVLSRVGARTAPGGRVGTFTAAGSVREGLRAAGFEVSKVTGFGRKRHRLDAIFPSAEPAVNPVITPIIVGAGIAGASLAQAFLRRGIAPTIIDAGDGRAASGNPAAIVKPRLDRQDKADSRFFLSSYLYALNRYSALGTVLSRGVLHAVQSDEERARFVALADQAPLPKGHMLWQGEDAARAGLFFPQAQIIDPLATVKAMSAGANLITRRCADVRRDGDSLRVVDGGGKTLATGSHVIFAAGAGVRELLQFDGLGLRFSRGQLSWAEGALAHALTYGGYAIPFGDRILLGATHGRLDGDEIYSPRPEDDQKNQEGFAAMTGEMPEVSSGRVSVRVNTAQTWPVIYDFGQGVAALSGLGSRGFVFAPLLGEHMVSKICAEVGALPDGLFCQGVNATRKIPNP